MIQIKQKMERENQRMKGLNERKFKFFMGKKF